MGHSPRKEAKPECISAAAARPSARFTRSSGQSFACGKVSCRYSEIARVSQTTSSPSFSTGTSFDGEWAAMIASEVPASRSCTRVSVNSTPTCFSTSQALSDQVDHLRVPMTISIPCFSFDSGLRGA